MDDWDLDAPQAKKSAPSGGSGFASGEEGVPTEKVAGAPAAATSQPVAGLATSTTGGAAEPAVAGIRQRRVSSRLLALALGALIVLLVGALAGFYMAQSQAQHSDAELATAREELGAIQKGLASAQEVNWSYHQENETLKAQVEALQKGANGGGASGSTTTTIPGLHATYSDGIYRVGEDIAPGDYNGEVTADVGYWARLRATDGLIGSIVANGLPMGNFVLTVNPNDVAVELRGVRITAR